MKKQTKMYRDENGCIYSFNLPKFKSIIESNARAKGLKKEEYERRLADRLSCSYETLVGWKKGKNSPQDINLIHDLEKALELSADALLFSKEKQLECELAKEKSQNAELVLENNSLKKKMKSNEHKQGHSSMVSIIEQLDNFSLKYDGFSNLIDMLIGKYIGEDIDYDESSYYAEELFYIIHEYNYRNSFAEILGFDGKRSEEEVSHYLDENKNIDENIFMNWMNEAVVDNHGNHLFDHGKIDLPGINLWNRLIESNVFDQEDSKRVKALLGELVKKWDRVHFPYSDIVISIQYEGIEVDKYIYGMGIVPPTHEDRMEIITSLLLLTNGDISKFALQNASQFHVDEFEMEIRIVYDLMRLV